MRIPALPVLAAASAALAVAMALSACTSHARRRAASDQDLTLAADDAPAGGAARLTVQDVAEDRPAASQSVRPDVAGRDRALAGAGPSPAQQQSCRTLVARFAPPYRALYQLLPPGVYVPGAAPLDQLVAEGGAGCGQASARAALVQAVTDAVTGHSGRVGVILPLSGPRAQFGAYVAGGLRAAFTEAGANFDRAVVLKDSGGSAKVAEAQLAELVFRDRVALVIGGLDHGEAEVLAKWSAELLLPTLLLNRDRDLAALGKQVFLLYPDEKRLADTLAGAALRRGFKRVAILKPATGKSDKVAAYFKAAVLAAGGQVPYDLAYTPNNFESMQGASRQMFKADAANRTDEFRRAYYKARQAAQQEGVPFDQRMVVLKPIVDFDAVFIPDDFRTVRHFAKLFKYHMVDHLALIGNHEWRSPALVDPYDNFLDGAIFADFIGSYSGLPPGVGAPTLGSPLFVQPTAVVQVDFQLIGYRAGRVACRAAQDPKVNRRQLPAALAGLAGDAAGFTGMPAVFDADRRSFWPTFLFSVGNRSLTLTGEAGSAAPTHAGVAGRAATRSTLASQR